MPELAVVESRGGPPSNSCSFWQPSCAFRWSAPDGSKRLRTAPTEAQIGAIFTSEGYSRWCRYSESVAAQRHLSPRRPANCGAVRPLLFYKKIAEKNLFHYILLFYNKLYLKYINNVNIKYRSMTWWWLEDGYIRLYFTFLYAIIR